MRLPAVWMIGRLRGRGTGGERRVTVRTVADLLGSSLCVVARSAALDLVEPNSAVRW
jgi:hypothetical protein